MVIFHGKMLVHQRVPKKWASTKQKKASFPNARRSFCPNCCSLWPALRGSRWVVSVNSCLGSRRWPEKKWGETDGFNLVQWHIMGYRWMNIWIWLNMNIGIAIMIYIYIILYSHTFIYIYMIWVLVWTQPKTLLVTSVHSKCQKPCENGSTPVIIWFNSFCCLSPKSCSARLPDFLGKTPYVCRFPMSLRLVSTEPSMPSL